MKTFNHACFILLSLWSASLIAETPAPKLILQITVDQLRGDLPDKFMKNMDDGGFRYLKKNAIWYANAHYNYSNTETAVGHTTLATGADPSEHGMVSNVWYNQQTQKLTYNIEDPHHPILSASSGANKKNEVESSQKLVTANGRSPANILASTLSDELSQFTNGKAKIFAVSVKDRGAVPLAGDAGKAFWFSKASGEFISSNYYYEKYPDWVNVWNKKQINRTFENKSWKLLHQQSRYLFADKDDQSWERDVADFGRTFPHRYTTADNKLFNIFLAFSPAGDELTLSFAKNIIEYENLGKDNITDFLAISFSSTDYVGHIFGPSSLEAEDNMLRLDRTLADLFTYVDKHIGLDNTLIVLSADHGAPDAPGSLQAIGIDAGNVALSKLKAITSSKILKKHFGFDKTLIKIYSPPYVYLDHELIKRKGLKLAQVEQTIADELIKIKGVAAAICSSAIKENRLADTYLNRAAIRNYHPQRSGDILILLKPYYFVNDLQGKSVATNHGGAWKYDTFVPVIFSGFNINGQRIHRKINPKDIAPTLSAILNIAPPSAASGNILQEVINSVKLK